MKPLLRGLLSLGLATSFLLAVVPPALAQRAIGNRPGTFTGTRGSFSDIGTGRWHAILVFRLEW